jgi:glycogen debranching enzyme
MGLRTLAPDDPLYRPDYTGDQAGRDAAYHQGVVWPWLIGIFTDALLKLYPKKKVREYIYRTFDELFTAHLERYGLKHVSEIFTPGPPHVAKGCMAQAWSEAEIIRALERLK